MAHDLEENPLEQLIELLVYAPIGLLYEYPDVLPRLIKRGKSQVQLAKFAGQLALKQQTKPTDVGGGAGGAGGPSVSPDVLVEGLARLFTEVGSMIGLAPPHAASSHAADNRTGSEDSSPKHSSGKNGNRDPASASADSSAGESVDSLPAPTDKLPIAGYDKLTAKNVIFLLEDLTVSQLRRVRRYEEANRNRKTVLTKIDRLLS